MQTTYYTYKEQTYYNLYELSEALGKDGVFIPLSISDDNLQELGVEVIHAEEPIETLRERKIMELKRQRDAAEVAPLPIMGIVMTMMTRHVIESMQLLSLYLCKARAQALIGLQQITKMLK